MKLAPHITLILTTAMLGCNKPQAMDSRSALNVVASIQTEADDESEHLYFVSDRFWGQLKNVYQLIGEKKFEEALIELDKLRDSGSLTDHEQARTWQTYSFVFAVMEQYGKAMHAMEKALYLNALPRETVAQTWWNLSQLQLAAKTPRPWRSKIAHSLENWLASQKLPSPNEYCDAASIYSSLALYDKALLCIDKAIEGVKEPDDSWVRFRSSLISRLNPDGETAESKVQRSKASEKPNCESGKTDHEVTPFAATQISPPEDLKTEGWVEVEFSVTKTGAVKDVHAMASEPPGVFDNLVVDAVHSWKFAPKQVAGERVETIGVRVKVEFKTNSR